MEITISNINTLWKICGYRPFYVQDSYAFAVFINWRKVALLSWIVPD